MMTWNSYAIFPPNEAINRKMRPSQVHRCTGDASVLATVLFSFTQPRPCRPPPLLVCDDMYVGPFLTWKILWAFPILWANFLSQLTLSAGVRTHAPPVVAASNRIISRMNHEIHLKQKKINKPRRPNLILCLIFPFLSPLPQILLLSRTPAWMGIKWTSATRTNACEQWQTHQKRESPLAQKRLVQVLLKEIQNLSEIL